MTEKYLIEAERVCEDGIKTSIGGVIGGWGLTVTHTSECQFVVGGTLFAIMVLRLMYYLWRIKKLGKRHQADFYVS